MNKSFLYIGDHCASVSSIGVGMFDFVQKFIYSIVALQEKLLQKKLGHKFKSSYSNSTSKKVYGKAASLELNGETQKNKLKLENNVKTILKKYNNNPEKLLDFVERSGTKIYKKHFANKILRIINCEEGFVSGLNGIKALYLNIILRITGENVKISGKTEPMFILRDLPLESCYMIQQFYKWYAMKLKLPGFDIASQENFQKFLAPSNDAKIKELSVEEILGLKEAIAREVEAINFVVDLAKSTEGSRKALKKMTAGGASI